MQKKLIFSYLFILATLFIFMSLSRPISEKMRGHFVAMLAPMWEKLIYLKSFLAQLPSSDHVFEHETGIKLSLQEQLQQLQVENRLLNNELLYLNQLFENQHGLSLQIKETGVQMPFHLEPSYQRYIQRLKDAINLKIHALPARVIFRSLDTWNSCLWINIGEINNQLYQTSIIAKNSPVLAGDSVVGVIDYVGQHQSRVRLITDTRLAPSVRVARGGEQDLLVSEQIEYLLHSLNQRKPAILLETDLQSLAEGLNKFKAALKPYKKTWYLAKGELRGCALPLGRTQSQVLKGTGFNYDFEDEESAARDLRTGKPLSHSQQAAIPILKVHDILVTTGMDGVFPPNLKVATVTKVDLLKEGDYFYELEAKPTASRLNEISIVFVIPPIRYEGEESLRAESLLK